MTSASDLAAASDSAATIIIPARYASTRFPGKPLISLQGASGKAKRLIQRAWEAAARVRDVHRVVVATDDPRIVDVVEAFGGAALLTSEGCRNGSERCAEAAALLGLTEGIIVNLQGDALLTPPEVIETLLATMRADPRLPASTPMIRCSASTIDTLLDSARAGVVGGTTVVTDASHNALYFSRRILPYFAPRTPPPPLFLHVGVYAYRADVLSRYRAHSPSAAELSEGLEQLRFLDMGVPIRMVEVADPVGGLWEVNNPSDTALVEAGLRARGLE